MEKDRVRLPRVRAPKKDYIRLLNLAIRTRATTRSEYCRQTGDTGRVSSPVAAVDIVRPHSGTDKLLRSVIQLVRGLGTTEHAECPRIMLGDGLAEGQDHAVQGLVPGSRTMRAIFADERLSQAAR